VRKRSFGGCEARRIAIDVQQLEDQAEFEVFGCIALILKSR